MKIKNIMMHLLLLGLLCPVFARAGGSTYIHTSSLPKDVKLPKEVSEYAYFEGETKAKSKDSDVLKDEGQKERTFFCDKNTPNDRWWSSYVAYDKARFGARGADKNLPWHGFSWNLEQAALVPGVYDAYARVMVSGGGSYELALTTESKRPKESIKSEKNNVHWVRLGSIEVSEQTKNLSLYIKTQKSAVRLDTVLLVKNNPQQAAVDFSRVDVTKPQWHKGSGIVFTEDSAVIGYRSSNPQAVSSVSVAMKTHDSARVEFKELEQVKEGEWHIPLAGCGWYDVSVKAKLVNGKVLERSLTAAVVGRQIADELRMKSVFGLWNVHGDKELIKLAGARWNRRMLSFREVKQEQLSAPTSECAHSYTLKEGLDYIGVFAFGMPMWSMQVPAGYKRHGFGNPFFPAKNWDTVADIVRSYACGRSVPKIMEMYNEPLAHWKGNDKQLVEYAKALRKGLKKVDKGAMVAGPCLYSIRLGDLQRLAKAGLFEHLDAISMHAYVGGTPPEGEYFEKIVGLKKLLADFKQEHKPVYLTEFGWTAVEGTWQPPVDRKTQTCYVPRSLSLAWSQGIDSLIYFVLKFNTSNKGEAGFSLFDNEDRPQPGYVSFATVAKWFAGSVPLGHYQLTPDVHMVAGKRGDKIQISLWSTGKAATVALPFEVLRAVDIFGKEITVDARKINLSVEPIYLEISAGGIEKIITRPTLTCPPAKLPTGVRWPLKLSDSELNKLPSGVYSGFKVGEKSIEVVPVKIVTALTIRDSKIIFPENSRQPKLMLTLKSNVADRDIGATIWLEGGKKMKLKIPPRSIRQAVFALKDYVPAKRMSSRINLEYDNAASSSEFEWTAIEAVDDIKKSAWADFTEWAKFGDAGEGGMCQGMLRMSYDKNGIRVQVKVEDDEHAQNLPPERLWAGDSLQLAFDLDKLKPWTAGVVGSGLSGHRVFEYTVGGKGDGAAAVFRNRSYSDKLKANELSAKAVAKVTRENTTTVYDVFFPWSELDVDTPLKAGSVIGFAAAVNDIDPKRGAKRHGIRLYKGIAQTKDAKEFGRVWLR